MSSKRDRMSGNEAVALAIKQVNPDVMPAFPITPSTELPQIVSTYISNGDIDTEFIPVESEHSSMSATIGASAAGAGQTVAEIRREADSMLRDAESLKNYAERIYERYESVAAVVDRISDGSSELLSAVKRLAGLDDSFATGLDYVSSGLGSISTGSEHLMAELQHTASGALIMNDRGLRTAGRALLNISVLQQTGTAAAAVEQDPESLKQLLAEDRGASLVKVVLKSGRRNQIRVHFAEAGHPVCGDVRYGTGGGRGLCLHAWRLTFVHPRTHESCTFETPPPPWARLS